MGGLIVGMVTKYAGGVVKGFAMIAGIVVTGVVQWMLYNKPLSLKDFIAVLLVSFSIYLHSKYPVNKAKPVVSQLAILCEDDAGKTRDMSPKKNAKAYTEEWKKMPVPEDNGYNIAKSRSGSTSPFRNVIDKVTHNEQYVDKNITNSHIKATPTVSALRPSRNNYGSGSDYSSYGSNDNIANIQNLSSKSPSSLMPRIRSKDSLLTMSVSPNSSLADLHHRTVSSSCMRVSVQ